MKLCRRWRGFSATGRGAGIYAFAPVGEPTVPSVIITINKISD